MQITFQSIRVEIGRSSWPAGIDARSSAARTWSQIERGELLNGKQ
jgi:hypothetical protein